MGRDVIRYRAQGPVKLPECFFVWSTFFDLGVRNTWFLYCTSRLDQNKYASRALLLVHSTHNLRISPEFGPRRPGRTINGRYAVTDVVDHVARQITFLPPAALDLPKMSLSL